MDKIGATTKVVFTVEQNVDIKVNVYRPSTNQNNKLTGVGANGKLATNSKQYFDNIIYS